MEKEENSNIDNKSAQSDVNEKSENSELKKEENGTPEINENDKEISLEDKIIELEDKLARTFAEMENQRRRFEKEKDDAFEYGGFAFAKEALSLIDNLERSKKILESDESLKNSDALKKTLEHLEIINKDL